MDYRIPQDPEVLALENIYRPKVDEITKMKIGATNVYLDGMNCRCLECNFGDMVSQALIMSAKRIEAQQQVESMANTSLALFASGDIRASIKMGNITKFDLEMALPYPNQLGKKNDYHQSKTEQPVCRNGVILIYHELSL